MNYRHAFHAGSFSDVMKHAILARILVYLARKDAPFRFIDTHAGAGRYDFAGPEAKRSPEWREGVARLLTAAPPVRIAALIEPYVRAIGPHDASGMPASYPGSPTIAQTLMRPQDRIALSEAHPEEREKLIAALGHDGRLSIVGTDGYVALNAYLPPKERRGLVLIDPPFEAVDELRRLEQALERAIHKWPTGIYVAWRPIREAAQDARFLNSLAAPGAPNILRLELDVGPGLLGAQGQRPLARAGLLVVNPPHTLFEEARSLLSWLAGLLARQGRGTHVCEWLTPPR
ncbi:MAG TPA: 23S rRNA (adenine(2030)-N(6))-methyltransferase RlmJ [Roseiarcus sp.]|jgi:23S rRNA (adenine2030-N6)-methyltransferase|nr:23S rRNA (adenine(2030)-N(6))-methyltransferase RlmJ [Roseiarcus sp.]